MLNLDITLAKEAAVCPYADIKIAGVDSHMAIYTHCRRGPKVWQSYKDASRVYKYQIQVSAKGFRAEQDMQTALCWQPGCTLAASSGLLQKHPFSCLSALAAL